MVQKVEKIIEDEIRPKLKSHNGDIKLVSVEDSIVNVKLLGACSGCPSADLTRKNLIEETLKKQLPWVKEVKLTREVNQDLIDMAKKILGNHI